jgi:hypothetical protein
VIYVVLDDVGFSAMGCYGGPIETPNIDRLAAGGVRYTWSQPFGEGYNSVGEDHRRRCTAGACNVC